MTDSTTMDGVSDAPIFVAEAPHRRRSDEGSVEALRERVRELGVDLRRNRAEARAGAHGAHRPRTGASPLGRPDRPGIF